MYSIIRTYILMSCTEVNPGEYTVSVYSTTRRRGDFVSEHEKWTNRVTVVNFENRNRFGSVDLSG